MIKSIVALCVGSSGAFSYEYLINAPLEELMLIIDEFNIIMSKKNGH